MADVVLIQPEFSPKTVAVPLGLLYIGTILDQNGYSVSLIDCNIDNDYLSTVKKEIKDATCVGISAMTSQTDKALQLSDCVKSTNENANVVWGGYHATLNPVQTAVDSSVDYVITGEGEYAMLELTSALESGKPVNAIQNLVYTEKNGKVKLNPRREFMDINNLPVPSWHLINVENYVNQTLPSGEKVRRLPVSTDRGCPNNCSFCYISSLKWRWMPRSPDKIVEEVQFLQDKYNINAVRFRGDNFCANKKRVQATYKLIINNKLDVKWHCDCRADYFSKSLDDETLEAMKRSGCEFFGIGAESGSEKMLKLINKGITTQDTLYSAKKCHKHKIVPNYSLMIGLPTETDYDISLTLNLMKNIKKLCPEARFIGPQIYRPYPGGDLINLAKKHGYRVPETLREWAKLVYTHEGLYGMQASWLPWIKNPEYIEFLSKYAYLLATPDQDKQIVKNIIKLRMKLRLFQIPLERQTTEAYSKIRKLMTTR